MDGTLIDCNADEFVPPYKEAILKKFAGEKEANVIAKTVLTSPVAMAANDGTRTNREVFFEYAKNTVTMPAEEFETRMTEFYTSEYDVIRSCVHEKPLMQEAVRVLKAKGYRTAVTTNPLFPKFALVKRLIWGGFGEKDFETVTSYETSRFSKPNPKYYTEVIAGLGMTAEETLVVGNDYEEDIRAGKQAGLTTFYLTDMPIPCESPGKAHDYEGDGKAFLKFAKALPILK